MAGMISSCPKVISSLIKWILVVSIHALSPVFIKSNPQMQGANQLRVAGDEMF